MIQLIAGCSLALFIAYLIIWIGDKAAYKAHLKGLQRAEKRRKSNAFALISTWDNTYFSGLDFDA